MQELNFNTNETENVGLGKLFGGWFKTALKIVAGIVSVANPVIGGLMYAGIEFAENQDWLRTSFDPLDPRGLYEPTPEENFILSHKTRSIGETMANISLMVLNFRNETDILKKIDLANRINFRGDFVLWYYQNYETAGLSEKAIASVSYLIEESLFPMFDIIHQEMKVLGYVQEATTYIYPANSEIRDLTPKTIKPFPVEIKYPSWIYVKEVLLTDNPRDTTPIEVTTDPKDVVTNPIEIITNPNDIVVEPIETVATPECTTTATKFYQKWWFWFAAGILTKKILD